MAQAQAMKHFTFHLLLIQSVLIPKLSLLAMAAEPEEKTKAGEAADPRVFQVFFFYDLNFQSLRDHMVKSMEQSGALADLVPLEDVLQDLGGNNRSLAT